MAIWYVYILLCNDGSFYTGITTNIKRRLQRHNSGRGSKYTRSKRPLELLYREKATTRAEAISREREIKSLSAENKKKLIKFGLGERFPSTSQF